MVKRGNNSILSSGRQFLKKIRCFKRVSNMDLLFDSNGEKFDIQQKQCIEEFVNCVFSVTLLVVLFFISDKIGQIQNENFNSETLYSIFMIPLFLSLTKYRDMFDSCFVSVKLEETCITVKRGFLYTKFDKLYMDDINNIELYRSIWGKIFGFSHIDLYAMGGYVQLPYIKDTENNFKLIQKIMTHVQKNQKGRADEN